MSTPEETRRQYQYAWGEDEIRRSDAEITKWEKEVASQVQYALRAGKLVLPEWVRTHPIPEGAHPVVGLADFDDYEALVNSDTWQRLSAQQDAVGALRVPTTLGRVSRDAARHLLTRGYLNTLLASLSAPLGEGDLNGLSDGRSD